MNLKNNITSQEPEGNKNPLIRHEKPLKFLVRVVQMTPKTI